MAEVSMDGISNLSPELQRAFQSALKAEAKPVEAIEKRKEIITERVKLIDDLIGRVGEVKGLMPDLTSPIAIRDLTVASANEEILSGTADKRLAVPGKHSLEVSQLAQSARALSNRFEDKDSTRVGSGYFSFQTVDGETREIFIDNENATLEGIADIVNSANMGMRASVINDQSDPDLPYRLILIADGSGVEDDVEYPEFYFIDGEEDFFIEEERSAQNAMVKYEGFEIESPSNEIKDLIRGVTLNVKGVTEPGRPTSVSIEQDVPKTTVKVKDLVEKVNGVLSFIQKQNDLKEDSDTLRTLGGDYSLRMAESRIRGALRENFLFQPGKSIQSLYDLGIQFTRKGTLDFDEKKFQHALQSNYDQVVQLLAGDGATTGIMPKLNNALNSIAGRSDSVLTSQKSSHSTRLKRMNEQLESKQKRAEKRLESLKGKLARTEAAIMQLQSQTQQIGAPQGGLAGLLG